MAEYGSFGAGFAPGLSQAGGWFSLVPQLREQQARLEEKRSREGLTTLKEALDLPSDVRGPYIDHLVQTLGIDPTLGAMFKRAGEDTTADIAEVLRVGLEADPVRTARVIQAKGGKEMMVFLSTLAKVKAASAQDEKLASLVGGLKGPATPPGYSFERTDTPPAAPPPQAAPMPPMPQGPELLAGPAEDVPTTTGTGALGGMAAPPPGAGPLAPPPARPRPAPISLRPPMDATEALRDVHQRRLDMYGAEMRKLGEFTRAVAEMSGGGIPEAQQRFIASERQRIEGEHKPFIESLGKRLETETAAAAKAKEPLTEPAKLFADRARALAAGNTREVTVLDAQIDGLGAKAITEFDATVRGLMPGKTLLTMGERDWPVFNTRREQQRTREAAAIGSEAARQRLAVPEKAATSEREKIISDVSNIKQMANVQGLYKPEFVGPVRARITAGKEKTGLGTLLPGEADFDSALAAYTNAVISVLSGANVPPAEFSRMEAQLPRKGQPPEVFEARVRQTEKNVHQVARDRRNTYAGTGVDLGGIPALPESSEESALRKLQERRQGKR